jgi:ABC-type transport system involved in multi-copper enzyme maturation permease subunit
MSAIIGCFRGEWLRARKSPFTWVLGVMLVVLILVLAYGIVALATSFLSHGGRSPTVAASSIPTIKAALSPSRFLRSTLGAFSGIGYGNAIAIILGVLIFGGDYSSSTQKMVFTQGPSRWATLAGKALTVALILLLYAIAALAAGAGASAVMGAAYGLPADWPGIADVLKAGLTAWLLMGLWATGGAMLVTLFRQTALAVGIGIVYSLGVEGLVLNTLRLTGTVSNAERGFPGANGTALVNSFGPGAGTALVDPIQATVVVTAFLATFFVVTLCVAQWRDVP